MYIDKLFNYVDVAPTPNENKNIMDLSNDELEILVNQMNAEGRSEKNSVKQSNDSKVTRFYPPHTHRIP